VSLCVWCRGCEKCKPERSEHLINQSIDVVILLMHLKEIGYECVKYICLTQNRHQCQVVVNSCGAFIFVWPRRGTDGGLL
jgi:hypothetical protein